MSGEHMSDQALRIIGRASSINVRKVMWTCEEAGIAWVRDEWEGCLGPMAAPGFLAMNPNGLVPVAIDEHGPLWESNTICRYLAGKAGRTDLLPIEPRQRADVEQWMDWQATDLNASWNYAFQAKVRGNPLFADENRIALSIEAWDGKMEILERRLASTDAFVTGPRFTLADIVIALSVNRWLLTPLARPRHPAIAAYCDRLRERPGCVEHCFNGTA
jgi:glutathione S-transferase